MAPPSKRHSSYSKKAQYSVFTGYLLAGLGALIGAALLGLSLWQPSSFAPLRGAASDAVAPAGEGTAIVRDESQSLYETISGYLRAGSQNAALREEVELARIRLEEAESVKTENERLKALLNLAEGEAEPVAVARLVGSSAASSRRFAAIGVGRTSGVKVGMPVHSARGVVGRILEVARGSSRVLLLTDSESVLPVRRAKDEVVAFAEGRGDGLLRIRLINLGTNPLEEGDLFVTSGAGGYYRPGMAVAIVSEVTSDGAVAKLIAEPSATDFVSIEPIFEPAAVRAAETPIEQPLSEEPVSN
ncbi:MAG: rod shape-determining protein MreC [Pseudomonadota bacterium]